MGCACCFPYLIFGSSPRLAWTAAGNRMTISVAVSPARWITALWPESRFPVPGAESAVVIPIILADDMNSFWGLRESMILS